MKKIVHAALASAAALALAACGSTDDASEEAMAENVEMPADEALAGEELEEPVADEGAVADEAADEAAAEAAAAEVDATAAAAEEAAQAAEAAMDAMQ